MKTHIHFVILAEKAVISMGLLDFTTIKQHSVSKMETCFSVLLLILMQYTHVQVIMLARKQSTYHVNKAIYEASLLPDNPQGRLHMFHKGHPLRTWLLESCVRKS